MERGRYKDVEYIEMNAKDCLFSYIKDLKHPVIVPKSLIIRSMTKGGYTSFSVSDDEVIMLQFKVTDDVRKFLIEALKEV